MGLYGNSSPDLSNATAIRPETFVPDDPTGLFGSIPDALSGGLQKIGQAELSVLGVGAVGIDKALSLGYGDRVTGAEDWWFGNLVDPSVQSVRSLDAQSRTMAGRITYGVGSVLTELAGGGAPGLAVTEFNNRALSEVAGGKSAAQADSLGANQALFAYLGAKLPASFFEGLGARAASGAAMNTGLGVIQRYAESSILSAQGDKRSDHVHPFSGEEMLTDAILGAAFGGVSHALEIYAGRREPENKEAPPPPPQVPDNVLDAAMGMEKARFEDAQLHSQEPIHQAQADDGLTEHVHALDAGEAWAGRRLDDESLVARDAVTPKVPSYDMRNDVSQMADAGAVESRLQHDEQLAIADRMIAERGDLFAPKGEKSKLSREQWAQVRTADFKKWFGEWEDGQPVAGRRSGIEADRGSNNDGGVSGGSPGVQKADAGTAGSAGRVWRLDSATGEPRVFYHETRDNFTTFDLNHPNRKDHGWLGTGVYVTSDKRLADAYAKLKTGSGDPRTMGFFADVRNPYVATIEEKQIGRFKNREWADRLTKTLKNLGYDGVVLEHPNGAMELVAFDPNQVRPAKENADTLDESNPPHQPNGKTTGATPLEAEAEAAPKLAPVDIPKPPEPPEHALPEEHAAIAAQADAVKADAPEWARDLLEADSPEVADADAHVERVKAVGEIMGCVLKSGVSDV